jgi:hypothetical protein
MPERLFIFLLGMYKFTTLATLFWVISPFGLLIASRTAASKFGSEKVITSDESEQAERIKSKKTEQSIIDIIRFTCNLHLYLYLIYKNF